MKEIVYGEKTKEKMFAGIEKLAKIVIPTLGPKGKNIALKSEFSDPVIINDGVTIAKEVELEDSIEDLGASIIKEAALKTNEIAGDGTTTATVLAYSMVKEGIKQINNGANEVKIRIGMNKAKEKCVEILKEISQEVDSNDEIEKIAKISSGDEATGKIIYDAFNMIGKDGIITTEESKTSSTFLDIVEGLKFSSGYISSYMVADEISNTEFLNIPYILVTNMKISNVDDILPLAEKVSKSGKALVLIVQDIEGEALSTLIINKMRGTFNSIAVKAPSFGENRKEILEDIALVTGAVFYDENTPIDLKDIDIKDLGSAKTVKVSRDNTIILNGSADREKLNDKIEEVKRQILETNIEIDKNNLRKRLSRLMGAVALIQVGAQTQTELNEKKLRIEDALCATRAAIEEGIVSGGGLEYLSVSIHLEEYVLSFDDEEWIGDKIVQKALDKPLYYIAQNAGENGDIVVQRVKEESEEIGYDANNNTLVVLKEKGIIDPTKVERVALESAISIASMILTTDGAIYQKETREKWFSLALFWLL